MNRLRPLYEGYFVPSPAVIRFCWESCQESHPLFDAIAIWRYALCDTLHFSLGVSFSLRRHYPCYTHPVM
jgi:hypothetical protein